MDEEDAHLVLVRDLNGASTDYYRCTLCNTEFYSDPQKPGDMAINFAVHVGRSHRGRKTVREDVSQTAARIVDEATGRLKK
jgi:hypothetical protein